MRWLIFLGVGFAFFQFNKPSGPDRSSLPEIPLQYSPGSVPYFRGLPAVVEFWATWCGPCRESVPHLNELLSSCSDLDLQVVGVTDEDVTTIERFRLRTPIRYSVAIDTPGLWARQLGVTALPTAFLVDVRGKILWSGLPQDLSESKVRDLLD